MVKVLTFDEAIEDSKSFRERHLLLGNGFSIACDTRFGYTSLLTKAKSFNAFSKARRLPKVFTKMDTEDFEQVIKILEEASNVSKIYSWCSFNAFKMIRDAKALKKILIETIANTHPANIKEIDNSKFVSCRDFLEHFLRDKEKGGGEIYTLNYDLLLYWARVHKRPYLGHDGFGGGRGKPLIWKNINDINDQTFHYLHGALHLSYDGAELHKHRWIPGSPLREQVLEKISSNKFPLFVAEGKSEQKLLKIQRDEYLRNSYDNFAQNMKQPNDTLFIFGHSLEDKDKHILDCIAKGTIRRVYVDLFGNPNSESYKKKWALAKKLDASRKLLKVKFFKSETANVWG